MVDEKALIKISLCVHLLSVVLIYMPYVFIQSALVEHPMEALRRAVETMAIALDATIIADSFVSHRQVLRQAIFNFINAILCKIAWDSFTLEYVIQRAEAV